jgi:hypothetical protein
MDNLRTLTATAPGAIRDRTAHAQAVIRALERMPAIKADKYKKALTYLIENYSPLITAPPPAPVHPQRAGARIRFREELTDDLLDRGDLLYGIGEEWARANREYSVLVTNPRYADGYNNGFGIGTGTAFGRTRGGNWEGVATAESVAESIGREDLSPSDNAAPLRRAYIEGLMQSRFAPTTVFDLSAEVMAANNNRGFGVSAPEDINTARWNKAIRRACKYGLEMVASDPAFTGKGAQVHFVLDGLGDLGGMARKQTIDDVRGRERTTAYVPITSSEICYVFRNWDRMQRTVRFWVNGREVQAPWLSNWSELDVSGKIVSSSWEAWQRYALKRRVLKGKS